MHGETSSGNYNPRIEEHSGHINDRLTNLITRTLREVPEKAQKQVSRELTALSEANIKKEKTLLNIEKVLMGEISEDLMLGFGLGLLLSHMH